MSRRYFWLKLHRDFFKRHDIQIIEDMPNGKDYVLFYLKLLVESIDHEGCLRFSDTIPYDEGMLATITRTNIDIVRSALKMFKQLKMVELFPDDTLYLRAVEAMTGSETDAARWKRDQRERDEQKLVLDKVRPCQDVSGKCQTELEIELEKEKDRKSVYPEDFSQFWEVYPRRIAKVKAWKAWQARLKEKVRSDMLIVCARNYGAACKKGGTDVQYIMHAATFLGPSHRWEDYETINDERAPAKRTVCPVCGAEQPVGYTGAMCMKCHAEMIEEDNHG